MQKIHCKKLTRNFRNMQMANVPASSTQHLVTTS